MNPEPTCQVSHFAIFLRGVLSISIVAASAFFLMPYAIATLYDFDNPDEYVEVMTQEEIDHVYPSGAPAYVYRDTQFQYVWDNMIGNPGANTGTLKVKLGWGMSYVANSPIPNDPSNLTWMRRPTRIEGELSATGERLTGLYCMSSIESHVEFKDLKLMGNSINPTYGTVSFRWDPFNGVEASGALDNCEIAQQMSLMLGNQVTITDSIFRSPNVGIWVYGVLGAGYNSPVGRVVIRRNQFIGIPRAFVFSDADTYADVGSPQENGMNLFMNCGTVVYVKEQSSPQSFVGNAWVETTAKNVRGDVAKSGEIFYTDPTAIKSKFVALAPEASHWEFVVNVDRALSYYPLDETTDNDGDGLTNAVEILLGTNPNAPDSDGDRLSDYEEVSRDGNPANYDPNVDTNPNNRDSDGDGFDDWEEVTQGYNPVDSGSFPPAHLMHSLQVPFFTLAGHRP